MLVQISSLKQSKYGRSINKRRVEQLAEQISEQGLLEPIILDNDNTVLDGWHRVEAYFYLGRTEIEAIIDPEAD